MDNDEYVLGPNYFLPNSNESPLNLTVKYFMSNLFSFSTIS